MLKVDELAWSAHELLPVIVQDWLSGEVRMVGFANREALERTLATGEGHFFSRSRGKLWKKGETSGNVLRVLQVRTDCDRDALLYLVEPHGPTCHTGKESCFFERIGGLKDGLQDVAERPGPVLVTLDETVHARRAATASASYTKSLLEGGPRRVAEKVREEGDELGRALEGETPERVVSEAADVLFHTLVGLLTRGVSFRDVLRELTRRMGRSGHAEKASRSTKNARERGD